MLKKQRQAEHLFYFLHAFLQVVRIQLAVGWLGTKYKFSYSGDGSCQIVFTTQS